MSAYEKLRPLDGADRAAERALLKRFADFWGSTQGEPRRAFDRFITDTPTAEGIDFDEVDAAGVRGSWVRPNGAGSDRVILYLHGGAYVVGSAVAFRGFASQIAQRTGVATFVLDYPLAPEHPWPAALDNTGLARRWLSDQGTRRIAIVGDSSGGGLTLATLGAGEGPPPVVGAVVFSPWTDLALTGASLRDVQDPLLERDYLTESAKKYAGEADVRDPRISPLYGIPTELPPLFIQVGTNERLLDDSRRYAAIVASRGGKVRLDIWEGLHHVFQLNVKELVSSRRALDEVAAFLKERFNEHL